MHWLLVYLGAGVAVWLVLVAFRVTIGLVSQTAADLYWRAALAFCDGLIRVVGFCLSISIITLAGYSVYLSWGG